jgi:hypothetical protein
MYSSTLSLTSAVDESGWSTPRLGRFTPGKGLGTHRIGGWVGPRPGLYGCGTSRPPDRPAVGSRYTDCLCYGIRTFSLLFI